MPGAAGLIGAGSAAGLSTNTHSVVKNKPAIGYLTISNALQWRLQYGRIVTLNETVDGISPIVKYEANIENE